MCGTPNRHIAKHGKDFWRAFEYNHFETSVHTSGKEVTFRVLLFFCYFFSRSFTHDVSNSRTEG